MLIPDSHIRLIESKDSLEHARMKRLLSPRASFIVRVELHSEHTYTNCVTMISYVFMVQASKRSWFELITLRTVHFRIYLYNGSVLTAKKVYTAKLSLNFYIVSCLSPFT